VAAYPLDLASLGCDFYTASCHKWLSGPHGTGFLYVRPELQSQIEPLAMGWGRVRPGMPESWQEWFIWLGTRDVSPILALPTALDFLEAVGMIRFRARTHFLAQLARARLLAMDGFTPIAPDSPQWYGPMVAVRHPHGDANGLRERLRQHYRIEGVVSPWQGESLVRVSCHLYTQPEEIELLAAALGKELGS
jgi:isopenicillin-N epimerase